MKKWRLVILISFVAVVSVFMILNKDTNNVPTSTEVQIVQNPVIEPQASDQPELSSTEPEPILLNSGVTYPLGNETWEKGVAYKISWNLPRVGYPVSVHAIAQDYGESKPDNCEVFFGSDDVDPATGSYSLSIPNDACPGKYKVEVCKYDQAVFEYSKCYENNGYVSIAERSESACSYPNATTDWGDGLYSCPTGNDQDQNRCYEGICRPCGGLLAYDQKAGKLGCWYLADPGLSCAQFCGAKGSMDGKWGDDANCSIGKKLTGCTSCSNEYDSGWLVPYYNIPKNMCVRNLGAGTYYTDGAKSEFTNIQRMCSCNY